MKHRPLIRLGLLLALSVGSGMTCPRAGLITEPPPMVFTSPEPSQADVIAAVDANRSRATSLYATRATLSGNQFPSMRASLAIASPRHVRLRAGTGYSGSEMDLGSNDQLFWLWVRRNPPTLVARHDQFAASPAARTFPVRPEWLVEAVGLVYLDPNGRHSGPFRRADGRLEIRTAMDTPTGQQTKVLVFDARSAYIYEQHLLGEQGQVIASAINGRHQRDPASGLVLPRETTLTWPALGLKLRLDLDEVQVNRVDLSPELWIKPQFPGFPEVDITTMAAGAPH